MSRELVSADLGERVGPDASELVAGSLLMLDALAQLPRQRACVVLRYYEDLSIEDAASVLGAAGTVKSRTAAAWCAPGGVRRQRRRTSSSATTSEKEATPW